MVDILADCRWRLAVVGRAWLEGFAVAGAGTSLELSFDYRAGGTGRLTT
jgi:hypothetical protein